MIPPLFMCVLGSAATLSTCDGVVNYNFIVHLLLSLTVTGLKNRETFGKVTNGGTFITHSS